MKLTLILPLELVLPENILQFILDFQNKINLERLHDFLKSFTESWLLRGIVSKTQANLADVYDILILNLVPE